METVQQMAEPTGAISGGKADGTAYFIWQKIQKDISDVFKRSSGKRLCISTDIL